MRSHLDRAADALFPADSRLVGNIKFFTLNRHVSSEQLAEQMNRADSQIANGESSPVQDIDGEDLCA